jgi:hypothetical protein
MLSTESVHDYVEPFSLTNLSSQCLATVRPNSSLDLIMEQPALVLIWRPYIRHDIRERPACCNITAMAVIYNLPDSGVPMHSPSQHVVPLRRMGHNCSPFYPLVLMRAL